MFVLSGMILPLFLMSTGAYFAFLAMPHLIKRNKRGGENASSLRALAVALAGTLGVGNVAGVASAIALGGAGAVFWMWVSALLAMFLKYAEVVLAVRYRRFDAEGRAHGGAPYYMRKAFRGRVSTVLSAVFALLCILCMFTLGGVVQSAAAAEAVAEAFGVPPLVTGVLLGMCACAVLCSGAKGVERACTLLVPLVCALFLIASLVAILLRGEALPHALAEIFKGAFCARSAAGGALGFLTSRAVRYGVARGIVSNEAGCGTAPMAHAAAAESPARQGLWGIVEVFVDTILLCTVTALVILVSGVPITDGGGMTYAIAAYSAILGSAAAPLLGVSVLIFAFATVLCWAHYGAESVWALTGRKSKRILPLCVWLACLVGAVAAPTLVWDATDLILALMTILNVTALILLRREVREESARL